MANGNGRVLSGSGSALDKLVEVAQRAGKWGIIGLCFLMGQALLGFVSDIGTWHSLKDFCASLASLFGSMGIGLTLIGLLANTKRGNDMTATIGAESKIDRAKIASVLDGTLPSEILPVSADKAVNREIKKLNGGPLGMGTDAKT